MTQQELANACGVSKGAVSQWETGDTKNLKLDNLLNICDTFGVRPKWLVSGNGPKQPGEEVTRDDDETDLLHLYRLLPVRDRRELLEIAKLKAAISIE